MKPYIMFWIASMLVIAGFAIFAFGCNSESEATVIMIRGLDAELRSTKERLIQIETEWDARYKFLGDLTETIRKEHGRAIDNLQQRMERAEAGK